MPTALESVEVDCDLDNAKWSFDVTTAGWSGGGEVLMSRDGDYLEIHHMPSVEATRDGTADRLSLTLSVLADWRDVTPGSSTIFNCAEPGLAGLLRVFHRDGEEVAGCAAFGVDATIWQTWRTDYRCEVEVVVDREHTTETGDG